MILLLIIAFIIVALFDVPRLMKKKYRRELMVYCVFLTVAFVLSLLQILDIRIPSPMRGITYLFINILHLNYPAG